MSNCILRKSSIKSDFIDVENIRSKLDHAIYEMKDPPAIINLFRFLTIEQCEFVIVEKHAGPWIVVNHSYADGISNRIHAFSLYDTRRDEWQKLVDCHYLDIDYDNVRPMASRYDIEQQKIVDQENNERYYATWHSRRR